ncbi:MAG: energy transducer TonB [Betaproteobacteria bacterium]|nr:energy transducer TonB [Betaproteobacteria bacterium]
MIWAQGLLTGAPDSLQWREALSPALHSNNTVSRRRYRQTASLNRTASPAVSYALGAAAEHRSAASLLAESWFLDPANRSLVVAIAISIVVHAILLKIHFIDPRTRSSELFQPTLDVVLVNARSNTAPKKAEVLAQANLDGGGNTDQARRAKTPLPAQSREQAQNDMTVVSRRVEAAEEQPKKPLTSSKSKDSIAQPLQDSKAEPQPQQDPLAKPDVAVLLTRSLEAARLQAEIDRNLDAYAKRPRRNFVGSRAREFRFARYVEDWRAKVERVGNLNYPERARQQKIYGSLQLTVSIKADGSVESIDVNKPSGQKVLDEAARRIVELAAPYAPFPPDIAKDTDILSITRTWTFTRADQLISQ